MTESLKIPLNFTINREPSTEELVRTVGRTDVVLLAFANENFYLNVKQDIDSEGNFEAKRMSFRRWQDTKNIDFNGWWQIEVMEDPSKATLRNFNSGKYLSYSNGIKLTQSPLELVDDSEMATQFKLLSINSNEIDINNFKDTDIFKVKVSDEEDSYLKVTSGDETDHLFAVDTNLDYKSLKVGIQELTNIDDTFKFIIPKQEEYMELSLCLDSRDYVDNFYMKISGSSNVIQKLGALKEGLAKVFTQLLDFSQNRMKGKIRVEYSVGEIVPHRQEMISKVGILTQVFKLLRLIDESLPEDIDYDDLLEFLEIDFEEFGDNDNLLEVLIKTVHVVSKNNVKNVSLCVKNISIIQRFSYVDGCAPLLIDIFKDKSFELNKKEIHSELLYRRIFEIERFKEMILHFTHILLDTRQFNLLLILRKMCCIDGNALPLVQDEICNILYVNENFDTRYRLKTNDSGLLYIIDNFHCKSPKEYLSTDFMDSKNGASTNEERIFLLEQLTLEADLCFGRN